MLQRSRSADVLWCLASTAVAVLLACVPLLFNVRRYFVDDSVNGAFGQWYHLGTELLRGSVPVLEVSAWSSGNLFAEGQWGFFNPLVILISLGAALTADAAVFTTIIKLIAIAIGASGIFVLARQYGARPRFAAAAGLLGPFSGFTMYFDAPSWVTGLFAWALIPWAWAAFTRVGRTPGGLIRAFLVGTLVVTIGYVHGTLALAMAIGAVLLARLVRRDFPGGGRVALAGVAVGLVAAATHITSLLTARVTNRGGTGVYMDQFMTLDLNGIVMGPITTSLPQAASWWWDGFTAPVPLAYLSWVLPLAFLVRWRRLFRVSPRLLEVAIAGAAFAVFIMLPTVVGPLRYPTRMLPYVAMCAIILIIVGLDRAKALTRSRVVLTVGTFAVGLFLAWAQTPQHSPRHVFAAAVVVAAALLIVWLARTGRERAIVAVLAATTVVVVSFQQWAYPRPVWPVQGLPTSVAALQQQATSAEGDMIVVGDPLAVSDPGVWAETLFANSWYVNGASVINRYQLLGYVGFNDLLCLGYVGETCPQLAESLFDERPDTGLTLADELSISSVQIIKSPSTEEYLDDPPAGWRIAEDGKFTQLWVREVPVAPAGGVVLAEDVSVTELSEDATEVRLRVDDVAADGGRVVFSRLAWPGYSVEGAELDEPADGFLVAVDVAADAAGEEIVLTFRPAGLTAALAMVGAAAALVVVSAVVSALRRRHRR